MRRMFLPQGVALLFWMFCGVLFIYPHVEVDGRPHSDVRMHFSFRDLP